MSRLGRRLFPLTSLVLTALLGIAATGCNRSAQQPSDEEALPAAKLETLNRGDQLINEGEDLRAQGERLNAQGQNGADLINQGDARIAEGKALKQKAMMMDE